MAQVGSDEQMLTSHHGGPEPTPDAGVAGMKTLTALQVRGGMSLPGKDCRKHCSSRLGWSPPFLPLISFSLSEVLCREDVQTTKAEPLG